MGNFKYRCHCGGICIWKAIEKAPRRCAFCNSYIYSEDATFLPAANQQQVRSPYTGKSKKEMVELANDFLGSGVNRQVYGLDASTVLKIGGSGANREEVLRWQKAKPSLKKYLAPVIDWDDINYEWLVMARAVVSHKAEYDIPWEVRDEIGDCHGRNVGYINKKPVIIDYAGGFRPNLPKVAVGA